MTSSVKMPNEIISRTRAPGSGPAPGAETSAAQGQGSSSSDAFSGILNSVTSSRAGASRDAAATASRSQSEPGKTPSAQSRDAKRDTQSAARADAADRQSAVRDRAQRSAATQQDKDTAVTAANAAASATTQQPAAVDEQDQTSEPAAPAIADAAAELLLMMGVGQAVAPVPSTMPSEQLAGIGSTESAVGSVTSEGGAATTQPSAQAGINQSMLQGREANPLAAAGYAVADGAASLAATQTATSQTPTSQVPAGQVPANQTGTAQADASAKDATSPMDASQLNERMLKTSKHSIEESGMAALLNQVTVRTDTKETRTADALVNANNLIAAMGGAGMAGGTQSLKDVAAALTANQPTLHERVGSTAWAHELASKLVVLSKQDVSAATLHMTPADMGPVRVHIETQQSQANVWFTADQADTRSAIEQSLPRLREMFAAQGMTLNDAGVSGQSAQQQSASASPAWRSAATAAEAEAPDTVTVSTLSLKLVDAYA